MAKSSLLTLALCLTLSCLAVDAKHINPEKTYQNAWCQANKGQQEVILFDKARVDCVTDTHAIEFDFASKWGESIGQALYYGSVTGKKPGIVLIMENPANEKQYLERVNTVAKKYGITVWVMTLADLYNFNSIAQNE